MRQTQKVPVEATDFVIRRRHGVAMPSPYALLHPTALQPYREQCTVDDTYFPHVRARYRTSI